MLDFLAEAPDQVKAKARSSSARRSPASILQCRLNEQGDFGEEASIEALG
jgi:hypothetical protein